MVEVPIPEPQPPPRVFNPVVPLPTARVFVQESFSHEKHRTLLHYGGQFYSWDNVCYREVENGTIRALLYTFLDGAQRIDRTGRLVPFAPNRQKVGEALAALQSVVHLPTNVINPPGWLGSNKANRPDPRELIACSNGLLHLPARQLLPPTPEFFSTSALDFPYDPDAPEPEVWLRFLDDLWPNDPESIATLQDMFGYFLVPDTRLEKIFLLVGPRRSGKGTIGRVLRGLLGPSNVCGPTLSSLSKNFGLQPLIGKLLATISDARLGANADKQIIAERLLSISGEDSLTIDRKYLPPLTTQLVCRILMLTNELPKIADASGALASRFIILKLTKSFLGHEDQTLTDRLLLERPGILNWAIDGWERLSARGHFVQPKSAIGKVQELEDLGSPIGTFVRERCVIGQGRRIASANLREKYRLWCGEQGLEIFIDASTFGRDLHAAVPGIETKQRRVKGKQVWHYIGIGLQ